MEAHITIHSLGDSFQIVADMTYNLGQVKQLIEEFRGVPSMDQRLILDTEELDDSQMLSNLSGMCEGCLALFLMRSMSEEKLHWLAECRKRPLGWLEFAPDLVYRDRQLMMLAVRYDASVLKSMSESFKADHEMVLVAIQTGDVAEVFEHAAQELRSDMAFMRRAIEGNAFALKEACNDIRNARDIVVFAGKRDWRVLKFAASSLKADDSFAVAAVKISCEAARFLNRDLLAQRDTAMALVRCNGLVLEYLPEEIKNDLELVLVAIGKNAKALDHASPTLLSNKDFVLAAAKLDRRILFHRTDNTRVTRLLQSDRSFAHNLLAQIPLALEQLRMYCDDRELVLSAVQADGLALKFAHGNLQDDRKLVMAAVQSTWRALEFAADRLKADAEVVQAAVKQSSCARRFSKLPKSS